MAKSFNIKDIKIKSKKDTPSLLTGDIYKGLLPGQKANAEIEGGEYVKTPNENVTKAEGPKHSQGGIKSNLPDETEIISDHLKLKSKDVALLKKQFGLDVTTKNTYADVLDKYQRKLGLDKITKKQEAAFEALQKLQKDDKVDKKTQTINLDYLSTIISSAEKDKAPLKAKQKELFDTLFELQEGSKPASERATSEYKAGGKIDNFFKKYNLSEEEGKRYIKKFADGGKSVFPDDDTAKKWNGDKGAEAYKAYKRAEAKLNNPEFRAKLHEQYKEDLKEQGYFRGKYKDQYQKGVQNLSEDELVKNLLRFEERNQRLKAFGLKQGADKSVAKDAPYITQQGYDLIKNNKDLQDLLPDLKENYKGQFAYINYNNLVTGNNKVGKTHKAEKVGESDETLAGQSGSNITPVDNVLGDTALGQMLDVKDETPAEPEKEKDKPATKSTDMNFQAPNVGQTNEVFIAPPTPFALGPRSQAYEYKGDVRYGQIDPLRLGVQQQLQTLNDSRQNEWAQYENLTPAARAKAIAMSSAKQGELENQAIFQTNLANAQNLSAAQQFNVGQATQQSIADNANRLDYQNRVLAGQENTWKELNDYIGFRNQVQNQRYDTQMKSALLKDMFPNVSLTNLGLGYAPDGRVLVNDMSKLNNFLAYVGQPERPIETTGDDEEENA
jgi:hypothetical protein